MRFSVGSSVACMLACSLVACASPTTSSSSPRPVSSKATSADPIPSPGASSPTTTAAPGGKLTSNITSLLTGTVTVPASLVAQGAGNIVAQGAGNIVAQGGGNIVAQGGGNIVASGAGNLISPNGGTYGLLATGDVPLANTEVAIQLANGNLLKRKGQVLVVRTNAQGTYRIYNLPADVTYQVVVFARTTGGAPAKLKALARAGASGGVADVTPASTLVTTKAVKGRKGLGELDLTALQDAIKATRAALEKDPAIDLTNEATVEARMETVTKADPTVSASMSAVSAKLEQNVVDPAQIESAVEQTKEPEPEAAPLCMTGLESSLLKNDAGKPAQFTGAVGVAVGTDAGGVTTLYVADRFDQKVWKYAPDGGKREEAAAEAGAVALAAGAKFFFVGTGRNNTINRYVGADKVALLEAAKDFGAIAGRLVEPMALAARDPNTLYVADTPKGRIFKVAAGADAVPTVTRLASKVEFAEPGGLAVDGAGTVYVADTFHHCIKKLDGDNAVVVAGVENAAGEVVAASEAAAEARFTMPVGIAVNAAGDTIYVADAGNQAIRMIKGGKVTTLAALQCGAGDPERLSNLGGLALSLDEQFLFVANGSHVVRFKLGAAPSPVPTATADVAATATAKPDGAATP